VTAASGRIVAAVSAEASFTAQPHSVCGTDSIHFVCISGSSNVWSNFKHAILNNTPVDFANGVESNMKDVVNNLH